MAAPTIYRSTDSSAPTLSGTAGDLVNLLDKCLVTGYGSKAAAGWTKPYTSTNGAVFRQGGSGFYWQVDDNAPGAATAKEARMRGYETMTAWNTGTGLFPTAAQLAAGIIARKSTTADATTRNWVVVADSRTVYVFILTGDTANAYLGVMFGDIYSYITGDNYKCMLIGRDAENTATPATVSENLPAILTNLNNANGQVGHYIARSYTGFGNAVACGKGGDRTFQYSLAAGGESTGMAGPIPFPNPADGGLYISPLRIKEGGSNAFSTLRGQLRGLYHQCHPVASFSDGDTFDGQGEHAGESFLLLKQTGTSGVSVGIYTVQTTEWATSP